MASHWERANRSDLVISTNAEGLWYQALEYFQWCDNNPIEVNETLKSGKEAGKIIVNKRVRPYLMKALCLHCGITEEYINSVLQTKDDTSLYYVVITKIRYTIDIQNIEMAMIGEYNPIFASKVLNLEGQEAPTLGVTVKVIQGLPPLYSSENQILQNGKVEIEEAEIVKEQSEKS